MKYSLNPHIFVFGKTIKKPKISISFLSYLLRGKQNILIDTVPDKAADAYIQDIESVLPVSQIDALILNHSEEDHSEACRPSWTVIPSCPSTARRPRRNGSSRRIRKLISASSSMAKA